jgi:hypothetical protein
MIEFKKLGLVLGAALAMACSSGDVGTGIDPTADTTGSTEEGIIRSTSLGGRNEVVLVWVKAFVNGSLVTRGCSGSYFAPRVVLTAAHCLQGVWAGQVFVYFGDNYEVEKAELTALGDTLVPPPVGSPSHWAQADSFEQHPSWNPALHAPDLGVIYLDRKPPFDPLPLARFRLDNSWNGKTATISGWGYGQATGPTTGTGFGVQRTGKQKIIGTPTAADYHDDDPNPGMLDPAIRQQVIKLDGRAPNSNGCFGDSGSPLIVNQYGQDYIAGVDYFGGFYCEDYSLHFRIDPFLPFLDNAYKKGGQETLIPKFMCQAPNQSGTRTAYFGYENKNGVAITLPYGTKNSAGSLDTKGFRPTKFPPGKVDYAFAIDFGTTQTLTYTLSPDNSPTTKLTVTKNSTACSGEQGADVVEAGNYCRGGALSGCPSLPPFSDCFQQGLSFNQEFNAYVPECKSQLTAYNACYANTTGAGWVCQDPGYYPYAPGCDDEWNTWLACAGFL